MLPQSRLTELPAHENSLFLPFPPRPRGFQSNSDLLLQSERRETARIPQSEPLRHACPTCGLRSVSSHGERSPVGGLVAVGASPPPALGSLPGSVGPSFPTRPSHLKEPSRPWTGGIHTPLADPRLPLAGADAPSAPSSRVVNPANPLIGGHDNHGRPRAAQSPGGLEGGAARSSGVWAGAQGRAQGRPPRHPPCVRRVDVSEGSGPAPAHSALSRLLPV